jgi:hypothetical protein
MTRTTRICQCFAAAAVIIVRASAQDSAPPTLPEPPPEPQDAPAPPPSSLDELLGIEEDQRDASGQRAAEQDSSEELKRQLQQRTISDSFRVAIEKMSLSADLLDRQFDSGLGTQRVQEEILARLDQLLDQARRQQSASSSSSSSSQRGGSSRNSQNQPGRKPHDADPQGSQRDRSSQPADSRAGEPPPMEQGDLSGALESTGAEWGNLPERIRELLLQGRKEKYSALYDRLTREYYRRLAEESSIP